MLKIGFDGGGTTTRAALIRHQNHSIEVLGRGQAGSSNHYGVGLEGARKTCRNAMNAALQAASTPMTAIEGFGFGLAGACSDAEKKLLRDALAPLCGSTPFVVEEDAVAAQSGAFAGGAGAILIAGTGANCFGINEAGERARADGWGPILGDRGGGYRIGESALRAVCSALDGAGASTSMVKPCLKKLGAATIDELVQIVYAKEFTRDRVAALFPIVLQETENGDMIAQNLLRDAARELAATARPVMKKLNLHRIALTGGVLDNSQIVRENFERALREEISNLEITVPRYDAAIGAALLLK